MLARKISTLTIFFVACLSTPLCCLGLISVLGASFAFPFAAEVILINRTQHTVFVTLLAKDEPQVIPPVFQSWRGFPALQQRDIPIQPNASKSLFYDTEDTVLLGVAVCNDADDCWLASAEDSRFLLDIYELTSPENLVPIERDAVSEFRQLPLYEWRVIGWPMLGILPIALLVAWLYLARNTAQSQ